MHRILVLLMLLPVAAAQPFMEDPADAGPMGGIDLRWLEVSEDASAFHFAVGLEGVESSLQGADLGGYDVAFSHGDRRFILRLGLGVGGGEWGNLYRYDEARDAYTWIRWTGAELAADTLRASVAREDLLDERGAAPLAGRELRDFVVESRAWHGQAADRMPDGGVGPAWAVQTGPVQEGMRLWSPEPFRASNGGAGVYVFKVHADNLGDVDDTYHIQLGALPTGWLVHAPESIALGAGRSRSFEIAVQTPSGHVHGGADVLRIEAHGTNTSATGRIDVGIRYLEVPQPAGHHPRLWMHSRDNGAFAGEVRDAVDSSTWQRFLYMNTLEDHEGDDQIPVKGQWGSAMRLQPGIAVEPGFVFPIFLDPGLEMGLAMDTNRSGAGQVSLRSPIPVLEARLTGGLWHCTRDLDGMYDCQSLASVASTARDVEGGQQASFEFTLQPNKHAARVAHERDAYLTLVLVLGGTRPTLGLGAEAPEIVPGGWFELPLVEYADESRIDWSQAINDNTTAVDTAAAVEASGWSALAGILVVAGASWRRRAGRA